MLLEELLDVPLLLLEGLLEVPLEVLLEIPLVLPEELLVEGVLLGALPGVLVDVLLEVLLDVPVSICSTLVKDRGKTLIHAINARLPQSSFNYRSKTYRRVGRPIYGKLLVLLAITVNARDIELPLDINDKTSSCVYEDERSAE